MTHLHFTFGPVQGFVAQARRTRDLYAGSFLLSQLAMSAMAGAAESSGEIVLPDYSKLKMWAGHPKTQHAIAPNRFIASFGNETTAAAAGTRATEALRSEWARIAEQVWNEFLKPVAGLGDDSRGIWQRQIANFWEIAWVVGDENESNLLDRRKNWRTPQVTKEGGDHCTLMGQWQELSGFLFSNQRAKQNAFWGAVREQSCVKRLDLESDERLCAIAFVKRFFPQVAKYDMQSWPSTVSIAAVPWQRKIASGNPEVLKRARDYAELVANESDFAVSSAQRISVHRNYPTEAGRFPKLSGNFLNQTALGNKQGTPLKSESRRNALSEALQDLEAAIGDRAGSHYAVLLMDGDSMGSLIRSYGAKPVTRALTAFSSQAPGIMDENDGVCIYAGGDDLLAMLPLDRALDAVAAVRTAYLTAFTAEKITGTISAGLVFTHYHCALSQVLRQAHHILDTVAKDGAGRDALAITVLKSSGISCQWTGKFGDFLGDSPHRFDALVKAFQHGEHRDGRGLSSSFLYNLRSRFAELFPNTEEAPFTGFSTETLEKLFIAEYLHGRLDDRPEKARQQRENAQQLICKLIQLCLQPDARYPSGSRFDIDGARLVKFLALDGKEGAE